MRRRRWVIFLVAGISVAYLGCCLVGLSLSLLSSLLRPGPVPTLRICDNLINSGYMTSKSQCTTNQALYSYIPHYFKIDESTIDFVEVGMMGFERVTYTKKGQCEDGSQRISMEYQIGFIDSAYFGFCNGILRSIHLDT